MAHVNIKPADKHTVYTTAEQAINHLFIFGVVAKNWDYGGNAFGRTIAEQRTINEAIKARNSKAFVAHRRRGFWRVELATV